MSCDMPFISDETARMNAPLSFFIDEIVGPVSLIRP